MFWGTGPRLCGEFFWGVKLPKGRILPIYIYFLPGHGYGGVGEDASQSRSPQVDSPAGECVRGRVCFGVVNKVVKRECCCCSRTV